MFFDQLESEESADSKNNKIEKPLKLVQLEAIKEIFAQIERPELKQLAIDAFEYNYGIMELHDESEMEGEARRFFSYRFETLDDAVDSFSHIVASLRFPSKKVSAYLDDYRCELLKQNRDSNDPIGTNMIIVILFFLIISIFRFPWSLYSNDVLFITKFINQNSTNYLRFVQALLRVDFQGKTDDVISFLKEKESLLLANSFDQLTAKSETIVLPSQLDTSEFKVILNKAIDAGFVVENINHYVWIGTNPQLAYFAEITSECLKFKSKYSPFCKLFNKKNLAQVRYKTKEYVGKVDRQDELDRLVRFD